MSTGPDRDRGRRQPGGLGRLAWGLCAAAQAMAAACVVLLLAGRVGLGEAVDAYLVNNLGMVVTFGAIGGLVAGNRPRNRSAGCSSATASASRWRPWPGRSRSPARTSCPPGACGPC